jgi:hypothetical protein
MMAGLLNIYPEQQGITSYGARYAESAYEPITLKGKGYFGLLPSSEGVSTEISATNDAGLSYPLMVPTLTQSELNYLLSGNAPTDEMYRKAEDWARYRQSIGADPFAQQNELRIPMDVLPGLLGR